MPKNSYTKRPINLYFFSILRHNLSKFVTQTGLYCSKQLETTFNQVGKKSLHIIFKPRAAHTNLRGTTLHAWKCTEWAKNKQDPPFAPIMLITLNMPEEDWYF